VGSLDLLVFSTIRGTIRVGLCSNIRHIGRS